MPPTDPLIYRFLRTGHGQRPGLEGADRARIWRRQSCRRIDFDMVMERLPNPKGDRVKITMMAPAARCLNAASRRGDDEASVNGA